METNRIGTSEKVIINGGIKTVNEFSEPRGIGFTLTLITQGQDLTSTKRELLNKLLTSTLLEMAKEEVLE